MSCESTASVEKRGTVSLLIHLMIHIVSVEKSSGFIIHSTPHRVTTTFNPLFSPISHRFNFTVHRPPSAFRFLLDVWRHSPLARDTVQRGDSLQLHQLHHFRWLHHARELCRCRLCHHECGAEVRYARQHRPLRSRVFDKQGQVCARVQLQNDSWASVNARLRMVSERWHADEG